MQRILEDTGLGGGLNVSGPPQGGSKSASAGVHSITEAQRTIDAQIDVGSTSTNGSSGGQCTTGTQLTSKQSQGLARPLTISSSGARPTAQAQLEPTTSGGTRPPRPSSRELTPQPRERNQSDRPGGCKKQRDLTTGRLHFQPLHVVMLLLIIVFLS